MGVGAIHKKLRGYGGKDALCASPLDDASTRYIWQLDNLDLRHYSFVYSRLGGRLVSGRRD